jgi:chromosome segregation ATPase
MSDTNSKGPKKDTDKIQFIKIGDEGELSSVLGKPGKQKDPISPPSGEDSSVEIREPVFNLDEDELIMTSEMPVPELGEIEDVSTTKHPDSRPELDEKIGQLKTQIEEFASLDEEKLSSNQVDLLKKYISLKEAEVRDAKEQQKQYQTFTKRLSAQLEKLTARHRDSLTDLEGTKRREEALSQEVESLKDKHEAELSILKNDLDDKLQRAGDVKSQANQLAQKREEWKDKVKDDLKRIKLKERELENKYELLKRDTQALLDSKDKHVLELKKKNDALDLELESFEERLRRANSILAAINSKKKRLIETMKLALSLLEQIDSEANALDDDERKAG